MPSDPVFRFRADGEAPAPIETVFAVLADHRSYADWSSCDESFLEREGDDDPGGFGAIRVLRDTSSVEGVTIDVRELVNHHWPPYLLGYRVLDTTVVREHQGVVLLEPIDDAATRVVWHMTASPVDPAHAEVMEDQIGAGVRQLVADLCAEAERRHVAVGRR